MKRNVLFIIALMIEVTTVVVAQNNTPAEMFERKWTIKQIDKLSKQHPANLPILNYDFSEVWIDNGYLGFKGDNYQRMRVAFTEGNKVATDEYKLKGTVAIDAMSRPIECTLHIVSVVSRDGDETEDIATEKIYDLFGAYTINIYSTYGDSHGTQKGVFYTSVYELDDTVSLNDLGGYADGWCNNLFCGWVINRKGKTQEKMHFGIGRIPDCGDLDVGVGEFIPNEKYYPYGWDNYMEELNAQSDYNDFEEIDGNGELPNNIKWMKNFRKWNDKDNTMIMYLDVIFMQNNKKIRSFRPYINSMLIPNENSRKFIGDVTMEDVNFDGHPDVLINMGSYGIRFQQAFACYLYDPMKKDYRYVREYQTLDDPNPIVKDQTIVSGGRSSYIEHEYISWKWQGFKLTPVSKLVGTIRDDEKTDFVEYDYDSAKGDWVETKKWTK